MFGKDGVRCVQRGNELKPLISVQAERLSKRMELRLKESEEKVSDLDARASIAKQRIAILERELEASRDTQKQLQSDLAAVKAQAAADEQRLQVRLMIMYHGKASH